MTDFETWLDDNFKALEEEFLEDNKDMWSCEDEGMALLESGMFIDYVEAKYKQMESD